MLRSGLKFTVWPARWPAVRAQAERVCSEQSPVEDYTAFAKVFADEGQNALAVISGDRVVDGAYVDWIRVVGYAVVPVHFLPAIPKQCIYARIPSSNPRTSGLSRQRVYCLFGVVVVGIGLGLLQPSSLGIAGTLWC